MIDRNDRKIFVGKNRFYLGKNNIIYVTLKEDINKETVLKMRGAFFKLLMMVDKCNILAINKKTGKTSLKTKKIFKEVSEGDNIEKVALLNMSPGARGLSSFMARFYKHENFNYFDSKENAIMWLKE